VKSQSGRLIAILDDEDVLRELYTEVFQERGFRVVSTSNKQRFLENLEQINPDVIISDVTCSPMDGLTFLERIKADEKYKTIPVIFATAHWSVQLRLYLNGAYAVLAKPVELDDLMACTGRAMRPYCTS
jgi:CheY-like chemotaxis protein